MASLTQPQIDILVAIMEEGEGRPVVGVAAVLHLTTGENREVDPADIRELEDQGILRKGRKRRPKS